MDIISLIDSTDEDDFPDNEFPLIKEGKTIITDRIDIPADTLKKIYGDKVKFSVTFSGHLLIKAGVLPKGRSFIWVGEASFKSDKPTTEFFEFDFSSIESGSLHVHIKAVEDTIIFPTAVGAQAKEVDEDKILAKFIWPDLELCSEEPLFVRFDGNLGGHFSFREGCIELKNEEMADLCTYFNSFSLEKWHKYTNIKHLSCYLEFMGKARAEVWVFTQKGQIHLVSFSLQSSQRKTFELPLGEYAPVGVLGLRIVGDELSKVYGGGYMSEDPRIQEVRLGIGITTFKREDAVKKSVARLCRKIEADPYFSKLIKITVVDNGRTVQKEDLPDVTLIPNRNLGGCGGFMRNLIHYQETGDRTHCLFMDDDAAAFAESIFKSIVFLEHATNDRATIAGGMLSADIKFLQWEAGAWFDHTPHPVHPNLDLRKAKNVATNEKEYTTNPIYGGWWFFMFPIKYAKTYSFPFFVRGDDVEFSYLNDFIIVTLNGVCSWQEDFKSKECPQTLYFDARSYLIHQLALELDQYDKRKVIQKLASLFNWFNNSYQYDTAKAINMAISGVLGGPKYWLKNMETDEIRNSLKKIMTYERRKELSPTYENKPSAEKGPQEIRRNFILQKLSMNGHLLPDFMFIQDTHALPFYKLPNENHVFLHKRILVYNVNTNKQWLIGKNSSYYFKNLINFKWNILKLSLKFNYLKRKYKKFYKNFENADFWINEFKK